MSYKVINIHPSMSPEEKEKIDRENTIFVCEIFKKHNEKMKQQIHENKWFFIGYISNVYNFMLIIGYIIYSKNH